MIVWVYGSGFLKLYNGVWGGIVLKLVFELIMVVCKFFIGMVVVNWYQYGIGGFNIDFCWIEMMDKFGGGD